LGTGRREKGFVRAKLRAINHIAHAIRHAGGTCRSILKILDIPCCRDREIFIMNKLEQHAAYLSRGFYKIKRKVPRGADCARDMVYVIIEATNTTSSLGPERLPATGTGMAHVPSSNASQ
jgi:hypothetical protein